MSRSVIVVYKCGVREVGTFKVPDVPDHAYNWRINEIETEYTEAGDIKEYFIVKSEMNTSEFEKIKDSVEVIKVMQL